MVGLEESGEGQEVAVFPVEAVESVGDVVGVAGGANFVHIGENVFAKCGPCPSGPKFLCREGKQTLFAQPQGIAKNLIDSVVVGASGDGTLDAIRSVSDDVLAECFADKDFPFHSSGIGGLLCFVGQSPFAKK